MAIRILIIRKIAQNFSLIVQEVADRNNRCGSDYLVFSPSEKWRDNLQKNECLKLNKQKTFYFIELFEKNYLSGEIDLLSMILGDLDKDACFMNQVVGFTFSRF